MGMVPALAATPADPVRVVYHLNEGNEQEDEQNEEQGEERLGKNQTVEKEQRRVEPEHGGGVRRIATAGDFAKRFRLRPWPFSTNILLPSDKREIRGVAHPQEPSSSFTVNR